MSPGRLPCIALAALAALLAAPLAAADTPKGAEVDMEALARQPARTLAQQANALLLVLGDREEAAMRLDAALESRDSEDVDLATLREAEELLDSGGSVERAQELVDSALSKPLGAGSGKAYHGGGREFRPATGAAEVVAIVAGAGLLLLGAAALRRRPHRTAPVGAPAPRP